MLAANVAGQPMRRAVDHDGELEEALQAADESLTGGSVGLVGERNASENDCPFWAAGFI